MCQRIREKQARIKECNLCGETVLIFCLQVVVAKGSQTSTSEKQVPKSFHHRDLKKNWEKNWVEEDILRQERFRKGMRAVHLSRLERAG